MRANLEYTVSEIAAKLEVDKSKVTLWSFQFKDYLSTKASPPKGTQRLYTLDDLSALVYIQYHWEEEPDVYCINVGLNRGEQFEHPFSEIAKDATPLFRAFDDNAFSPNLWVVGGEFNVQDLIQIADAFKKAGDNIMDACKEDIHDSVSINPALYNYRHAVELYLKACIPDFPEIHNLGKLYLKFKSILTEKHKVAPPDWFDNVIMTFDQFDSGSLTFRYGVDWNEEMIIEIPLIKEKMEAFADAMRKVYREL